MEKETNSVEKKSKSLEPSFSRLLVFVSRLLDLVSRLLDFFSRLLDCGSSEIEKRQGRHKDILLTHATISIGFSLCTPKISDYLKKKH